MRQHKLSGLGRIVQAVGASFAVAWLVAMLQTSSLAQSIPGTRIEDRLPRYGGYLPYGGYPADSGAPLGGYTPFGIEGPEAGWLKVDYGFGPEDFSGSFVFGSDVLDGLHRGNSTGFERRPRERGRGRWNDYGRAGVNPPTVWNVNKPR